MPNIGPMEIIIVLIIGLVVLGPKRLPEMGKSVGRGMREFKNALTMGDDDEDDEDAYDTVGGFIVHRVGRIPLPGAEIPFRDDIVLRVEAAEPRRVARVVAARRREAREGGEDPKTAATA